MAIRPAEQQKTSNVGFPISQRVHKNDHLKRECCRMSSSMWNCYLAEQCRLTPSFIPSSTDLVIDWSCRRMVLVFWTQPCSQFSYPYRERTDNPVWWQLLHAASSHGDTKSSYLNPFELSYTLHIIEISSLQQHTTSFIPNYNSNQRWQIWPYTSAEQVNFTQQNLIIYG